MKCKSEFIFKSLEQRQAGKFTNEKGECIDYPQSFVMKVDEATDNGINERKFKFPIDNTDLANKLYKLQPYTKIMLELEVVLYGSQARVTPTNIVDVK